jgi:Family of unknown function (DUF6491)
MKTAFLLLTVLLLSACASSVPQSRLGAEQKAREKQQIKLTRTSDCVFQSTVNDFAVLDDTHVVLYSGGQRKAYLVELAGGCFDVRTQSTLAAIDGDRNGQICGFGRDSIAYRRMGLVEDCPIMGMQELSDERRAELGLGAPPARKPKKEEKQKADPPPAESK